MKKKFWKKDQNKEKIDAQWKMLTRLSIIRWRKQNPEDESDDESLAEKFMNEAALEGWCKKINGEWRLKELKFNKKELKRMLIEAGESEDEVEELEGEKKPKIARNAPCPCGSNRKFKRCCGMKEKK